MACIATPAALTHIGINGKEKEGCPNGNPAMCTMFGMLGNVPGPTDEIWEFGVGGGVLMGPDLFMFYSMTDAIYAIVLICMVAWWRKAQVIDVKAQGAPSLPRSACQAAARLSRSWVHHS